MLPIMAKQEQVLVLEPASELRFVGPFTEVVTSHLKLWNPLDRVVCFKVKTTAPKKYCVRPNSGIIQPKKAVHIAVMLQPFDYNPTEKNKHKFMVQSMIVPEEESNIEILWRDAKPESLMDSKLRCVFDMPSNEAVQSNNLDSVAAQGEDNTATTKIVAEPTVIKSSPKACSVEGEIKKLLKENQSLRDAMEDLRRENLKLKEHGLRQRSSEARGYNQQDSSTDPKPSFGGQLQEQQHSSMVILAAFLTIGLLGIFLGKFVV